MPTITLKYTGRCRECGLLLREGESAFYAGPSRLWCLDCAEDQEEYMNPQRNTSSANSTTSSTTTVLKQLKELPEGFLGLLPDPPLPLAEAAYHILCKMYHPDTGHGDNEKMKQLNMAIDLLRKRFE